MQHNEWQQGEAVLHINEFLTFSLILSQQIQPNPPTSPLTPFSDNRSAINVVLIFSPQQ